MDHHMLKSVHNTDTPIGIPKHPSHHQTNQPPQEQSTKGLTYQAKLFNTLNHSKDSQNPSE